MASPHPHFSLFTEGLGIALTAAHSPSSILPLSFPAPKMAQVHLPQDLSLFRTILTPHASASPSVKYGAYKNISPIRLLQTLNRGADTLSEDQLPSHFPCLCITPVPSNPHLYGCHYVSMAPCHPITLLCPEAPASPRHQQHPGQLGLLSSAQDFSPGLCLLSLRPGILLGLQGHHFSVCLTFSLHADQRHSRPRQTLPVSGALFPFWWALGFKPGTYS